MTLKKNNEGNYPLLKLYGDYLLNEKLEVFTEELIRISFEVDIPLLKFFSHLTPRQLVELSKPNQIEFLKFLSAGNVQGHIDNSIMRWVSDQLPLIGKYDVQAEDLTLAVYARGKALKSLLSEYTSNLNTLALLRDEIDHLILCYNSAFTNVYIGILKDKVTEEAKFSKTVVDTSPGMTFIYDLIKQREIFITGKVLEVTGHTPEEILNNPDLIADLTHPDDQQSLNTFIHNVLSDSVGNSHQADYRIKTKSGNYIWLRCYSVVYRRNEEGIPVQILGVSYDITKEKEISAALQKREKQLLEAQAIGNIGSFDWDIINDISISTPQLRKIFEADHRQTLEEMLSKVHSEDKEKVTRALSEAFKTGIYQCEYRYNAPSRQKVIDTRGKITFTEDGRPNFLVGTIQDITERKLIEEDLTNKTKELSDSNEQLKQFAYIASHDLKEPLRKISMFSNQILTSDNEILVEKTRFKLEKINDAAKRMQHLIEGLLAYSYLNYNENKELHNLEDSLKEVLNNLEYRIQETKAVILSDGLPIAKVVPYQMQQLFQNLISNAIKFSRKDVEPNITITHSILKADMVNNETVHKSSKYLQIIVSDNGIGFKNEGQQKIFELFQRLHTRSEYEGSGLGLAICKRIVQNHGGSITATSIENEGSKFIILLPYN